MRQGIRSSRVGRVAFAVILSCLLATSSMVEGLASAQLAYAESAQTEQPQTERGSGQGEQAGSSQAVSDDAGTSSNGAKPEDTHPGSVSDDGLTSPSAAPDNIDQVREQVDLGVITGEAVSKNDDNSASGSVPGQVEGERPLAGDDAQATIGVVLYEGVRYEVQPDGITVDITGIDTAPQGDVVVPASIRSGADEFRVTGVSARAFAGCTDMKSIALPATVERVADDAFEGCTSLASIEVSKTNSSFSSFDGMLFDKEGTKLVRCPEGKAGAANLPETAVDVHPDAFKGCAKLVRVDAAEESLAFTSVGGVLYTKALDKVLFCPAGMGEALVIPSEVRAIAERACASCDLKAITALGDVQEIAADAFSDETRANAVVALPAGDDYDVRKAVWEAAGFVKFAEPARPGDTTGPTQDPNPDANGAENAPETSGLAYTLLDDYTLSVAWQGAEDPAAELVIPSSAEVGGVAYRVSTVAEGGFANRGSITSVQLPETVTTVGVSAFAGCANLASVNLPSGLQVVGDKAFNATSLNQIVLPASVNSVGEQAFAACEGLTRIVALGEPRVADSALSGCTNVAVYCPANAKGAYPWNVGLPASGNHLMPYGVSLSSETLQLSEGESADLFDGGVLEAPEGVEVSYAYAAKPLSVDAGQVTGKAPGASEVSVVLALDDMQLARATRAVEVASAPESEQISEPAASSMDESEVASRAAYINETVALASNTQVTPFAGNFNYADFEFAPTTIDGVSGCSIALSQQGKTNFTGGEIPSEYNGLPVLEIVAYGFSYAQNAVSIIIPDSIRSIGTGAFFQCSYLEEVIIGSSVSDIPNDCFTACPRLKKIIVKGEVNSIGANALPFPITGGNGIVYLPANRFDYFKTVWMKANVSGQIIMSYGSFTLSFDAQSGSPTPSSQSLELGDKATKPQNPTRTGYTFSGWHQGSANGSEWDFAADTMPFRNVVLYAKWIPNTYTILFDGNGANSGIAPQNIKVTYDQDVAIPANTFQRTGYTFSYWSTQPNEGGRNFVPSTTSSRPNLSAINGTTVKLYANWRPVSYSLYFDVQSGSPQPTAQTIQYEQKATKPSDPSRTGYAFGGWWTAQNGGGTQWNFDTTTMPASDTTLYAKWTPISYTLSFSAQSGSPQPTAQTIQYEQKATKPSDPSRTGYAFGGWWTAANGGGTQWNFTTSTMPAANTVLYAKWTPYTYTISFDGNQATSGSAPANVTASYDQDVVMPANTFVKPGYTFTGWNTKADGTGTRFSAEATVTKPNLTDQNNGSVTLYAQWEKLGDIAQGEDGTCSWTIDGAGHLTIYPTNGESGVLSSPNGPGEVSWDQYRASITSVEIKPGVAAQGSMSYLFYNCVNLVSADVSGLDTTNATSMGALFANCSSLTSVDVSGFKTSQVTDMDNMFYDCSKLDSLNVSGFDTSKVIRFDHAFAKCAALTSLDVSRFNTSSAKDMTNMFYGCSKIAALDVSGFDTSLVTSMNGLFYGCSSLTTLDVSGFDTSRVTSMENMFANCSGITTLDVAGFDTSQVTSMANMFNNCSSLTTLNVSGFDTSRVTNMNYQFYNCSSLAALDVSAFDTSNVWGLEGVFINCSKLKALDVSNFDTSKATSMGYMFSGCTALTALDVSGFNTAKSTRLDGMFHSCSSLSKLDFSGFDTSSATATGYLLYNCSGISSVLLPSTFGKIMQDTFTNFPGSVEVCDVPELVESSENYSGTVYLMTEAAVGAKDKWTSAGYNVVDNAATAIAKGVSGGCSWIIDAVGALTVFPTNGVSGTLEAWSGQNAVPWYAQRASITSAKILPGVSAEGSIEWMFADCSAMTSIDLSGFDTSRVTSMYAMFYKCKVPSLDLSSLSTSSVVNMSSMFRMAEISSLDLSEFNTSRVTAMDAMFYSCSNLESLDVSSFDTSSVTTMASMFFGCSALTSLDLSNFDTSQVTYMSSMFENCVRMAHLDVSNFNTAQVQYMGYMFNGCSALTSLDVTGFNTSKAVNMANMFGRCSALTLLDVSSFDTSKVTDFNSMFTGCNALVSLDLSSFDTSAATDMDLMISNCSKLESVTISDGFTKVLQGTFQYAGPIYIYAYGAPTEVAKITDHTGCVYLLSEAASQALEKWSDAGYMLEDRYSKQDYGPLGYSLIPESNGEHVRVFLKENATDSHIPIPREVIFEGARRTVTELDYRAFAYSQITSVNIPDTVTKFGMHAFAHCTQLKSVTIAGPFTNPDGMAFAGCTSLASISLPTALTEISRYMFQGCTALRSVKMPENVIRIAEGAFKSSGLTQVVIPQTTDVIEDEAFHSCSSLSEVLLIRESGLSVGANAFLSSNANVYVLPGYKAAAASSVTGEGAADLIGRMTELSAGTIRVPKGALGSTRTVTPPADRVAPSLIDLPFEWSAPAEANLAVNGRSEATVTYAANPYNLTGELVYYDAAGARTVAASTSGTVAPTTSHKVTFKLQKPGESTPTTVVTSYTTTGADGKQYIDDPGASAVYGYTFNGWADQATGAVLAFNNGKAEVTGNVTVVGTYVVKVNVTVPLTAEVKFDASGTMTPASLKFESRTVAPVKVSSVKGALDTEGSAALIPDQEQRGRVKALVTLGDSFNSKLALDGATQLSPNVVLDAAAQDSAVNLAGTVGFDFQDAGVQVNYQSNEGSKPFASLTWTVGL